MAPVALPPGFRFHPTDEELVAYYLKRKACGLHIEFDVIGELDLYKAEPWDLPDKSLLKTKDCEWYFFCPRDKKYPNGSRANRATEVGYWKATGKDRKVCSGARTVGMKKTLVFYKGRAPHGERTDWVMHEYRLDEGYEKARAIQSAFVLCRIFKKGGPGPRNGEQYGAPLLDDDEATGTPEEGDPKMLVPFEDETHSILSALPVAIEPWNGRANVAPGALNEGFNDIDRYLEEMCRNDPAESPLGLEFLIDEDAGDLHTPGLTYVFADATDVQVVEGEPSKVPEQFSPQAQDLTHTFNLDEFPPVPDGLDFETVMGMTLDDFIHPDPEEADILEEILHAVVADAQEGEAQGEITGLEIHQDTDSLAFSSEFVEGDFLELDDLDVPLDGLYPVLQGEGINWPTIYGEANYSSLQEVDSGIEIRGRTRWAAGNPTEPVEQGMARRRIRLERRAPEHPIQSGVWMNNSELCLSPESLDRLGRNGDHQHVSTYEHIPVPEVRRFDSGEFSDSGNMNSHQAVNLSNSDNEVGDRILVSLNSVTGLSCSSSSQMQMGGVYVDPGINLELCNLKNLSGGSSDESYVFFEPVRDSLGLLEWQFDGIDDRENESERGRSSAALRPLPSEILDSEASFGAQSSEGRDFPSCSSSRLSSVVVETVNSSAVLTSNHCKCLLSSELGLDVLPSDICRESSGESISHQIPGDHHSLASAVVKMPAVSSSAVPSHQLSKPLQKLLELFGTIPTLPAIAAELPADLKPMKFAENENLFLESGPVLHPLNTTVMSAVLTVTSPLSRHGVAQLEGSHSVKSFAGMASSSCSLDRGYCVYAEERQSPGAKQKPCEVCSCAQGSTTGEPSFEESLKAFFHFSSFGIKHLRAFKRTFILLFFLGTTSALFFTCLLREVRRFSRCMLTTML